MRFALPSVPCYLPRNGLAMLSLFWCLQSCSYFCWAPLLRALPARRFFAVPPTSCCLLATALHPLLSTSCLSDHGCVCAAVGVSAGPLLHALLPRRFFTLPLLFQPFSADDYSPEPPFGLLHSRSRHSRRAPRLHTLLALWSSRLAAFLYAAALGGRPNVVRGSGLSGLFFEVWLAVPFSGAASLAGQVSMRFAFAAVLLPATSTFVCCRGYFGCFPFSFVS